MFEASVAAVQASPDISGKVELRSVPLDRIRDNPFQVRIELERVPLEALAATIKSQGVLQPPVVRPGPGADEYQLLSGKRRLEAVRLLRDAAQTPEEREKYSTLQVRVVLDVDDAAACRWAIADNVGHVELNPLEMSDAVGQYIKLTGETPETVARNTGLTPSETEGLLLLVSALDFIREACGRGLGANLPARGSDEEKQALARRRLCLSSAVAFQHAYDYLSRHSRQSDPKIRSGLKMLVRKALLEDWSVREVKLALRALTGTRRASVNGTHRRAEHSARVAEEGMEPLPPAADGDAPVLELEPLPRVPVPDLEELMRPGEHLGYSVDREQFVIHRTQLAKLTFEERMRIHTVFFQVMGEIEEPH